MRSVRRRAFSATRSLAAVASPGWGQPWGRPMPRKPYGSLADVPHKELALALRTQSTRQIARSYGVTDGAVRYWREQLQIPMPGREQPPGPQVLPTVLAYLQATAAGATTSALCQALGVAKPTLYRALWRLEQDGQVTRTWERMATRWQGQARWYASQHFPERRSTLP